MSYQLELRHIRNFLVVAEELHFRKAADRLYISQPGLSRQIKLMEEGLGFGLFERHNRKVELTEAGKFLQSELQQTLWSLDQSIQHAKLINQGLQGELKFGYVGSAMQKIIPDLMVAFRRKYPDVLFSLKEMDNEQQIKLLHSQDIDIGFVRLERVPRGLEIRPVLREPFCLVLPEKHPLKASNFVSMAQLESESFILFDKQYSPSYHEKVMQIFDDVGFSPSVTHHTVHASSIYKLVENGFGISIVPKSLSQYHNGIKFIELKGLYQRTLLSAVWSLTNRNPILKNVVALLKSG
ncbi:MAG: LysR family transcriptional regulator [Saprospiraceae bacterium]|nr:LysR family transcriptional regulator [Saprospiraceae bacterium]